MVFRAFRINCLVRLVFLAGSLYLFIHLFQNTGLYATTVIVGGAVILQVISLLYYIEATNRQLTRFLLAVRYSDFSQSFSGRRKGRTFGELGAAFDEVMNEFHRTRAEKEEHYRYLQTLVQHVGLGIISFDTDGRVDLINNAAKRLLQRNHLRNIRVLDELSPELVEKLFAIGSGERALVKIDLPEESMTLAVYATELIQGGRTIKLISMQNIESELAEQEMAAWQKLIRVLTHEIMNSVTPIASLASTINGMMADLSVTGGGTRRDESCEDIKAAAGTIERRSRGLLHFVEDYRDLTRIPRPDYSIFPVKELLERVVTLLNGQIEAKDITLEIGVLPENLEMTADPELLEQVLINLVINAVQSLEGRSDKKVIMKACIDRRGKAVISIADNGPGISNEIKDRIFTPFFTTKKGGSGIGLSLARQIMRLHKGSISVQSHPGEMTSFNLRF